MTPHIGLLGAVDIAARRPYVISREKQEPARQVNRPNFTRYGCGCTACGGGLREIGQDVSEVLDYEPGTFHVVRHVRPRLACAGCHTITQALALSQPMDSCMAAGLLTHIAVSKFADQCAAVRAVPDLWP